MRLVLGYLSPSAIELHSLDETCLNYGHSTDDEHLLVGVEGRENAKQNQCQHRAQHQDPHTHQLEPLTAVNKNNTLSPHTSHTEEESRQKYKLKTLRCIGVPFWKVH